MKTHVYPDRIRLIPETPLEAQALNQWAKRQPSIWGERRDCTLTIGCSHVKSEDRLYDLVIEFPADVTKPQLTSLQMAESLKWEPNPKFGMKDHVVRCSEETDGVLFQVDAKTAMFNVEKSVRAAIRIPHRAFSDVRQLHKTLSAILNDTRNFGTVFGDSIPAIIEWPS